MSWWSEDSQRRRAEMAEEIMRAPPADVLLAVDIGNSRVGMAVWDDDGLHDTLRVGVQDLSAWRPALEATWNGAAAARRRAVVISSVRPRVTRAFADLAADVCQADPFIIHTDVPLPIELEVDKEQVGVDRVCAAAAAYDRLRGPCAVASFGTATTIDCVSPDGRFLGGAILPGLQMGVDALHRDAEQLPEVELRTPAGVFGRDTSEAIVSGIIYGAVGALRELVERYASELNEWPHVVITGGAAPLIAPHADFVDSHVPDLCLMGVALAYRRAAGQP